MAPKAELLKDELTEEVIRQVRERLDQPRSAPAERFVRQFYANVPPDDIVQVSADQLYGAALAMWQLGQQRLPGRPRVRVHNPRIDSDGWQSHRTVVEIVNDDMPFLVDSVTAELNRQGMTVHLVIHPVVRVARGADGRLTDLYEPAAAPVEATAESFMHVEVGAVTDPAALESARAGLERVLADVRHAVEDWRGMRERVRSAIAEADTALASLPPEEVEEAKAFLAWVDDDHFTYLGYREYRFEETGGEPGLTLVENSGLGILRDDAVTVFDGLRNFASLPPDVRDHLRQPRVLMVTKGNRPSTVHRPVALDTLLVKRFDAEGRIVGERLVAGLFTSAAYNRNTREIPFLRRKVADVLARAGFDPRSHDGKALTNIVETYPRDELFQIAVPELYDIAIGILHLQERQRLALFVRKDPFERFRSCLVYVPRDRYDTDLRRRIQAILESAYNGTCTAFYTQIGESVLARLHVIVRTEPGRVPEVDTADLEARLLQAARDWTDLLKEALTGAHGEEQGTRLFARYGAAFPTGYREMYSAETAVFDIDRIERSLAGGQLGINLHRPLEAAEDELHFKIYHAGSPVPLSDVLPMLEHMDLKVITEVPFEVRIAGTTEPVWIHDFSTRSQAAAGDCALVKEKFQDAFAAVWDGRMEDDGFNRLVLRAGLTAREVTLVRAYAKYLRQARFAYAQDTVEATLAAHAAITRLVVRLFHARFDPAHGTDAASDEERLLAEIGERLDGVSNLDEDRILRRFVNLVTATLRTNAYQPAADGQPKPYVSFKLDSQAVEELPLPRPWVEVFVYSPRMEGVHLRGGRVARGGIRWSDRREDFRTEILGLMKAQMVKNSVIVPVGSKGGFVLKRPPPAAAGREAFLAEGIECYKTLMRGLLDITDNLAADGSVLPPRDVMRRDGDDPYLVVAADKGTATFSDIANGVSIDYGFWLGDAFASGGSAGYDHKRMGITARGAWESVKRHFREIGKDIQAEDFTVVGVGDMSGDVFGNGMLLSKHIRMVGAFDHRHIVCDPDPDPAVSWAERKRLFDLPRSSWDDYDKALLSAGGAVFPRSAKSLALTPQIKARFGIAADHVTPQELMQAMLRADVELLWFGGIGTYVKASEESQADAGDKANDALRIDGGQIRARVVGEGANLGVTQRGRIEAARRGIRLNTDAIDNSAGVDTSDHEVNIKILLNDVVARGDMTGKQRDVLLAGMTEEVGQLVLADNYLQTQALSVAQTQGPDGLDIQARFMRSLERAGRLNRRIEFLPDEEEIASRLSDREGLTRPELAVLLAYAKITLYDDLLASDLPDDPFMVDDLVRYFPKALRKGFAEAIQRHKLRREIIATSVTNSIVNRTGPTFVKEMMDKTGMGPADVARAYAIVRDGFGLRSLWTTIEDLDNRVPAATQTAMIVETVRLMERTVVWFLANLPQPMDVAAVTGAFRPGIEELAAGLDGFLDAEEANRLATRCRTQAELGVPEEAARRIAALPVLAAAPDLVSIATRTGRSVAQVAAVYFLLGRRFGLEWLRDKAALVKTDNHWQKQAVGAIIDDLFAHQTQLTVRVLEGAGGSGPTPVEDWSAERRPVVERVEQLLSELRTQPAIELSMLAVANRQLRGLTGG
ncbi:NAD-glutamate dehydrogenase [Azospirillum sp. RWY-5-1]|uniref:NAD-glutamate dehydrogenase n=1 Tax=Azospirillum oleiclasticum TaxID=2735135 RepID=A0ABX2TH55_9PROT|nr:NAD-glutamate dehydrogenase [Azospirillum oleiclasticum]NYZ16701.1 NAD-glutamate dehydrogenase [Azospirillum oleiclasticum]NYZ23397.1 NAD-glutamate dehydrogenase [Azospirillum oleiclasticum]